MSLRYLVIAIIKKVKMEVVSQLLHLFASIVSILEINTRAKIVFLYNNKIPQFHPPTIT